MRNVASVENRSNVREQEQWWARERSDTVIRQVDQNRIVTGQKAADLIRGPATVLID